MQRAVGASAAVVLAAAMVCAQPVRDVGAGVRLDARTDSVAALTDRGLMITVRVMAEGKALPLKDCGQYFTCGLPEGKEVTVEVEPGPEVKPEAKAGSWAQVIDWVRGGEKARLFLDGRLQLTEAKGGYVLGPFDGEELAFAVGGGDTEPGIVYAHVEGGERLWNGKGPVQWVVFAVGGGEGRRRAMVDSLPLAHSGSGIAYSFSFQPVVVGAEGPKPWGRGALCVRCVHSGKPEAVIGLLDERGKRFEVGRYKIYESSVLRGPRVLSGYRMRYFESFDRKASGGVQSERFYAIGKNVGWQKEPLKDYPRIFQEMRRAGMNTCRIWAASWHIPLMTGDWDGGLDPVNGYIWDELFRMAYEEGIYLIPVLDNAYDVTKNAAKHPLMKATGAKDVAEFMKSDKGQRLFAEYVAEASARFSAFPSLLMIEAMNEPDHALLQDMNRAERARAVREVLTPWVDCVVLQLWLERVTAGLWDSSLLGELDGVHCFTQIHVFLPPEEELKKLEEFSEAELVFNQVKMARETTEGPVIVGEFGYRPPSGQADAPDAAANHLDKEGIALRNALWASLAAGAAGPVLPWWWETHIEKYGLDKHITAVSKFLEKVDLAPLCETYIPSPAGMEVSLYGMRGRGGAFLLLLDPDATARSRLAGKIPQVRKGLTLSLPGFRPGRYTVKFWGLDTGEVVGEYFQNASADGWLFIPVPEFREGLGVTVVVETLAK